MKTKDRLIVHFLLKELLARMETDKSASIHPIWTKIYSRLELQNILRWLFMGKDPDFLDLETMTSQQLLDEINDDYHMVSYFIEQKHNEFESVLKPTPQGVAEVLSQLELETHYLASKPIEKWDGYDHQNFSVLRQRSGTEDLLYGIFPASMDLKDKYVTPVMGKYYKHLWKAQATIGLLTSTGEYKAEDYQILPL